MVQDFIEFNRQHLNKHLSEKEYKKAYEMEKQINSYQNELRKEARKRIKTGSSVKSELLYIDILRHVKNIGDFSLDIARSLTQIH